MTSKFANTGIGTVSVAVAVAFIAKLIITGQNSSVTIVGLICSIIGLFISGKSFIKKSKTRIDVPNSCIILILKKKQKIKKLKKKPKKKLKFALKKQKLVRRSY
ncbi:unnamed protein product [Rhizophagus irregularis]|nr:unnamed protein product [Rhizophagus irregularis]